MNLEEIALIVERGKWPFKQFWAFLPEGYVEGELASPEELAKYEEEKIHGSESPGDAISVIMGIYAAAEDAMNSLEDEELSKGINSLTLMNMKVFAYDRIWNVGWGLVRISAINIWGFGSMLPVPSQRL